MYTSLTALWWLWAAWLLSWLLAAFWTSKTAKRQSPGSRLAQSLPIWIGAILLAHPISWSLLASFLFPWRPWIGWTGLTLTAVGFGFAWWARLHIGPLWSSGVTLKDRHALIRSGPYAITRHPIYSGLLLSLVATALARDDLAAILGAALIMGGLVLKLRQEEQFLESEFGPAYQAYRREVPALLPRLW
jgi:protein-S-isoprenylcysteine O-methyltransferase Ste14